MRDGLFEKEQAGTLKPIDVYLFRIAQMLNDFALHGTILLLCDVLGHVDLSSSQIRLRRRRHR